MKKYTHEELFDRKIKIIDKQIEAFEYAIKYMPKKYKEYKLLPKVLTNFITQKVDLLEIESKRLEKEKIDE